MDDPPAGCENPGMPPVAEGFPNQVHLVLPPAVCAAAARQPVTRELLPTAAGYFPVATDHFMERKDGGADYIVLLCVAGEGWVELRGNRSPLRAGELAVLPPRAAHRYGAAPDAWTIYWCHLSGRLAGDCVALLGGAEGSPVALAPAGRAAAGLEEILRVLQRGYGRVELVRASTLLLGWCGLVNELRAGAEERGASAGARVLATAQWLRSKVDGRVSVEEMARAAGLSPSHFSTLFRARLGYSPLEFHLRVKVQRAVELLASSPAAVSEVAAAVGFEDPLYFSRVFRRIMGEPPSAYAARQRGR